MKKSHGKHISVDYTGYKKPVEDDGQWMLNLLEEAVEQSTARCVHSHVEVFDGTVSPLGFASVVLLDESHITAHCYSDRGWLSIDCFTCGETDPNSILDIVCSKLHSAMPNLKQQKRIETKRFIYE